MKKEDRLMTVKEMYKRYKDIINFAIIFLVIVPVCMYILALTPSSIGFMEPEDARVWLTYYGAIVGGGMTLWGVAWTISNQHKLHASDLADEERRRKEELALLYKPLLRFKNSELVKLPEWAENLPTTTVQYFLYFENVGRGEAVDFNVETNDKLIANILDGNFTDPHILPINEQLQLVVNINVEHLSVYEPLQDFYVILHFNDARYNKYTYKYHFGFTYFDADPILRHFTVEVT